MAKLTIKKIKCFEQEDFTGDDDIRIVVQTSEGRRTVWNGSMDDGQTRNLGSIEVPFNGNAIIQLLEEDWPDGDDNLGTVTVTAASSSAVDREARFTGDGANYTVWYRVSTEADEPEGGNGQCHPPNPLLDWLGELFESWTGQPWGTGGMSCPMGTLAVEVKDTEGNPIEGAQVRLVQTGQTGLTDSNGIYSFGQQPEGEYTVEAKKENYTPNPGSGTVFLAAETSAVAEVVLSTVIIDVTPTGDKRWYVNEDPDESKRHGREVTVTAQTNPAVQGVRVYFTLVYSTSNRTGLPGHMQASATPGSGLTDASGKVTVKLKLSRYGGDWFRIKASLTPSTPPNSEGDKYSGWFQVWRKLYYETDCMGRPTGGGTYANRVNRTGLQSAMDKVFIELKTTGSDNSPAHQRVMNDSEVGAWATGLRTGGHQPRYFHLIFLDTIAVDEATTTNTYRMPFLKGVVTLQASNFCIDPRDWFSSATYTEVGGAHSGNLAVANFSLDVDNPYNTYKLHIDLTGVPDIDPTVTPVDVRIVLKTWNELSGLQTGPATIIGMRWRERSKSGAALTNSTLNTMMHEPGHAFGMAATTYPSGGNISTTYFKNGHHCSYTPRCLMYESNSGAIDFCPNCRDACRGRNLASLPQSGSAGY